MVAIPVKHDHPRVLPQRDMKEVRCWSEHHEGRTHKIALYDAETNTLFTRCKCGSWQPILLAELC